MGSKGSRLKGCSRNGKVRKEKGKEARANCRREREGNGRKKEGKRRRQ